MVQEKFKTDFQDGGCGGHLGFLIRIILFIFDLQVTPILPTKIPVNCPFGSGEEIQNRLARWQPSWISDQKVYQKVALILPTKLSVGLFVQNFKIHFQDGGYLGFPIGKSLAFLDLRVALVLPTKFRVSWRFDSGEEVQNRFPESGHGSHLGLPI